MVKVGERQEVVPERRYTVVVEQCDYCGEDATELVDCQKCGKDLCKLHLLYAGVGSMAQGSSAIKGTYCCRPCLIELVVERFEDPEAVSEQKKEE